jgi:hypothetical protein
MQKCSWWWMVSKREYGIQSGGWSREERQRETERDKEREMWGGLRFSSNANKRSEKVSALLMSQ